VGPVLRKRRRVNPSYLLLLPAGFVAGLVNTLAGGGSFLSLPALMFCGLPPQVANGSNRIAILVQCAVGVRQFNQTGHLRLHGLGRLLAPSLAGAAVGVTLAASLPETVFQKSFGLLFLAMAALFLVKPRLLLHAQRQPLHAPSLEIAAFFLMGLYGGFIQAGAGVLMLMAMALFTHRDLMASNAVKLVLIFAWQIVALVGFTLAGQVDWIAGLVLTLGNIPGAILGARLAVARGARLIFAALIVVMIATGVRLLWA